MAPSVRGLASASETGGENLSLLFSPSGASRHLPRRGRQGDRPPLHLILIPVKKILLYCAFNLTGSTIYKKLSLPSVGVITQGEILVFRAKRTVSAGAYRSASIK